MGGGQTLRSILHSRVNIVLHFFVVYVIYVLADRHKTI